MFIVSLVTINLALVCYTIGVWGERLQRVLKRWHVVFFGLGLANDAFGTFVMTRIAAANEAAGESSGVLQQIMGVSGSIALALMAVHFVWAVVVLVRNRPRELAGFHTFSVVVWAIWLVPYLAGAVASMAG
ncbi:MAG: TIGR03987 family protein [Actinobacteria bacterium]|nr:TIGR03987 family protein [Actinomycetota bacterium]